MLMKNFKTVDQAKDKIQRLQHYVDLVEDFQPKNLEEHVLKEYAELGNIVKVTEKLNRLGFRLNDSEIETKDISTILRKRGANDLHKVLRTLYLKKTRASRRTSYNYS